MSKIKRKQKDGRSSLSSDEEGERARFISAVDPKLFSMAGVSKNRKSETGCNMDDKAHGSEVSGNNGDLITKSNRPRESDIEGEFSKPYSLDVTPECQKVIIKKLTKALDRYIEDVPENSVDLKESSGANDSHGIYLLSSSKYKISDKDVKKYLNPKRKKQKKPNLLVKRHVDGSDSDDDYSKLKHVAVSAEWVLNKNSL